MEWSGNDPSSALWSSVGNRCCAPSWSPVGVPGREEGESFVMEICSLSCHRPLCAVLDVSSESITSLRSILFFRRKVNSDLFVGTCVTGVGGPDCCDRVLRREEVVVEPRRVPMLPERARPWDENCFPLPLCTHDDSRSVARGEPCAELETFLWSPWWLDEDSVRPRGLCGRLLPVLVKPRLRRRSAALPVAVVLSLLNVGLCCLASSLDAPVWYRFSFDTSDWSEGAPPCEDCEFPMDSRRPHPLCRRGSVMCLMSVVKAMALASTRRAPVRGEVG